jgi:hypothetical protein
VLSRQGRLISLHLDTPAHAPRCAEPCRKGFVNHPTAAFGIIRNEEAFMAIARRLAIAAAFAACLFQRALAAPAPSPSLVDQFKAGCSSELYAANPAFASFVNVGSADGLRFDNLMDETRHSLGDLQRSMDELNVQRADIVEIRVEATSATNLKEVETSFAKSADLIGLPFSYRVVESLPASARVGFYAVADASHQSAQTSACAR